MNLASIPDFELANPVYAGASVSFFTVNPSTLTATTTLVTLYADPLGQTPAANPQGLDSTGKFEAPVYVGVPCIAVVSGITAPSTTTGIIFPNFLNTTVPYRPCVFDFMTAAQIADVQSGTGSIDCAAAIQAAENALSSAIGSQPNGSRTGELYFPPGLYLVSGTLTKSRSTRWNGPGGALTFPSLAPNTNAITIGDIANGSEATNLMSGGAVGLDLIGPGTFTSFTGNGSQAVFTVPGQPANSTTRVYVNGALQTGGGINYTLSGTTLTFTSAPAAPPYSAIGANVIVLTTTNGTVGILVGGANTVAYGVTLEKITARGFESIVAQGSNAYDLFLDTCQLQQGLYGLNLPSGLTNAGEKVGGRNNIISSNVTAVFHRSAGVDLDLSGGAIDYNIVYGLDIDVAFCSAKLLGVHQESNAYCIDIGNSTQAGYPTVTVVAPDLVKQYGSASVPAFDGSHVNLTVLGGECEVANGTQVNLIAATGAGNVLVYGLSPKTGGITNLVNTTGCTGLYDVMAYFGGILWKTNAPLTSTAAIAAASAAITGAITAASVSATGAISGGSVSTTGALSAGSAAFTGVIAGSTANGLTASTTQTQLGALQLTAQQNFVTTVASSGNAVKLPADVIGEWIDIYNEGGNPMKVFPQGGSDTIDGGSAAASVTLTNAKRCRYTCVAANTWISAQFGVASA